MTVFHSIIAPDSEHLAAIGRVAVQWTFVERSIEMLVWELAGLRQPHSQAVTTHLQTLALLNMAKTLLNQRFPGTPLEERLKVILNLVGSELRPKRNKVVHGVWGPTGTPDKISITETTARGVYKFKVGEEMSAQDILEIAAEIDKAHLQLIHLAFEVAGAMRVLPAA